MPENTIHLTSKTVAATPVPDTGRVIYKDDKTPGLKLVVTSTGCKSFMLVKRIKGSLRWVTLGRAESMSVSAARLAATSKAAEIASGDAVKRQKTMTFAEVFAEYIEKHAKPRKRTWKQDVNAQRLYLRSLGRRRMDTIKRGDVASLHTSLTRDRGSCTANRVLALLSKVFNFAIGDMDMEIANPCAYVKKNKHGHRRRVLSASEIKRFFDALYSDATPEIWRDFFTVALFTGARRGNVQRMRWADIDDEQAVWTIPAADAKSGEAIEVHLAQPVMDVLARRSQCAGKCPYVFESPRKPGQPISEPKATWRNILHRANIDDFRIHDLRRTMGSFQAAGGTSLHIIGKSLGHHNESTTKIYAQLSREPVRAAVNAAADAMLAAGMPDKSD